MRKKTALLILILVCVTALLLFFALKSELKKGTPPQPVTTEKVIEKTATVAFSPEKVTATANAFTPHTASIVVDSGKSEIMGVQLEIVFDPNVVTSIAWQPLAGDTFFGAQGAATELFRDVDLKNGRASYAVAFTNPGQARTGTGKVATVTFTAKQPTTGNTSPITFSSKTTALTRGNTQSVIKDTIPLTIDFAGSN